VATNGESTFEIWKPGNTTLRTSAYRCVPALSPRIVAIQRLVMRGTLPNVQLEWSRRISQLMFDMADISDAEQVKIVSFKCPLKTQRVCSASVGGATCRSREDSVPMRVQMHLF
jgi:hypothetical protein